MGALLFRMFHFLASELGTALDPWVAAGQRPQMVSTQTSDGVSHTRDSFYATRSACMEFLAFRNGFGMQLEHCG